MLQRIGLIAIPVGLIFAVIAWRSAPELEPRQSSTPMFKPQERPGSNAWGGLNWGASAKEVRDLYPGADGNGTGLHDLDIGGVRMGAVLVYEKNRLIEVYLDPSPAGCEQFDHLGEILTSRYGTPDTSRARQRGWQTRTSLIVLLCGDDGQLHLIYQDRAAAKLRLREKEAAGEAKMKDQSRGL